MKEISSKLFDYKDRTFVGEFSELEAHHGEIGFDFGIRSSVTGAVVKFSRAGCERDSEGELQFVEYESEYLHSIQGHLRAIIFND